MFRVDIVNSLDVSNCRARVSSSTRIQSIPCGTLLGMYKGPIVKPLIERFWEYVCITESCWLWTGNVGKQGYGRIMDQHPSKRLLVAHRLAYELLIGPVTSDQHLDHLCHNADLTCRDTIYCPHRRCVNPAHLEPVTNAENGRRARRRAQQIRPISACPANHPYDSTNSYYETNSRGVVRRRCHICRRAQIRKAKAKAKAKARH